ncbi:MAG: hypothetical protein WC233_11045, partial [Sphaerochaeta sp.]
VESVVIGRDARLYAPAVMEAAIEGFSAIGLDVFVNPNQISTCQFYYSCMQHPKSAGMMITASHNPGTYIGMKLVAPNLVTLAMGNGPRGGIAAIREFYIEDAPLRANERGRVRVFRYLDQFIDYSTRLAGLSANELDGVSILTDFLCGSSGAEISEALANVGANLRIRNLVPDGKFPAGDPNPIVADSIAPTWDLMKSGAYDFGFCFDGDGDRMDIMNSHGEQITPSFNLSLLIPEVKHFFKEVHESGFFGSDPFDPHLYYDVKANPPSIVEQARQGIGVHIIRNGHSFIKEALRRNLSKQYIVASEESAHYYMNFPYDLSDFSKGFAATENTLYFTLLTAKAWSRDPKRYEKAFAMQQAIHREREWPCEFFSDEYLEPVVAEVQAIFEGQGLTVFTEMEDGSSLDATLMRAGLPAKIDANTNLNGDWLQVAQRISRSEEGIARWEVASSSPERLEQAVQQIREVTDRYVNEEKARYE